MRHNTINITTFAALKLPEMEHNGKQDLLDRRYLRMARIWAENSYCERRKVGALMVKGRTIISLSLIHI